MFENMSWIHFLSTFLPIYVVLVPLEHLLMCNRSSTKKIEKILVCRLKLLLLYCLWKLRSYASQMSDFCKDMPQGVPRKRRAGISVVFYHRWISWQM